MEGLIGCGSTNPGVKKPARKLTGHFGKVVDLFWANDTNMYSIGQDGYAIKWNAESGNKVGQFQTKSAFMMTVGTNPDQSLIATGGLDNNCTVYKGMDGTIAATLEEHEGYCGKARFMDANTLLTGSGDSTVIQWDVANSKNLMQFKGHADGSGIDSLAISPANPSQFATGAVDKSCILWDAKAGATPATKIDVKDDVNDVAWSGNGNVVYCAGYKGKCYAFDMRNAAEPVMTFEDAGIKGTECLAMSVSKSGDVVYAGYATESGDMRAYNAVTGEVYKAEKLGDAGCSAIEVSPDGTAVAFGNWDKLIKVTNADANPENPWSKKPASKSGGCSLA